MNMVFRCAARLIAISAFVAIMPTFVSASEGQRNADFRLAMGPMSAAQKNQGNTQAEAAPAKPDPGVWHHSHHHTRHHRPHHVP